MNQEFHEIKYLLCAQMFDAARIAEAFRKRALVRRRVARRRQPAARRAAEVDLPTPTPIPKRRPSLNLTAVLVRAGARATLGGDGQQRGRRATWARSSRRTRPASSTYGVDHVRSHLHARPLQAEALADAPRPVRERAGRRARRARDDRAARARLGRLRAGAPRSTSAPRDEYFRRCAAAGSGRPARRAARSLPSSACSKETPHELLRVRGLPLQRRPRCCACATSRRATSTSAG